MYLGGRRRLQCTFRDFPTAVGEQGPLADPTGVTCEVWTQTKNPTQSALVVALTVVRDSAGTYHADYLTDTVGVFRIVWNGAGVVAASDVEFLTVTAK